MRRTLLGLLVAAPLVLGTPAARAQVIVGDTGQASAQSFETSQSADSQNVSANTATSGQGVGAAVILGDVDQDGSQSIASEQDGGTLQVSSNDAGNAQSVVGGVHVGATGQGNEQFVSSDQVTSDGLQVSHNGLSNDQLIAGLVIVGDRGQANAQEAVTNQAADTGTSDGTVIILGGVEIDLPEGGLPTVGAGPIVLNPDDSSTEQDADTEVTNSQVILG